MQAPLVVDTYERVTDLAPTHAGTRRATLAESTGVSVLNNELYPVDIPESSTKFGELISLTKQEVFNTCTILWSAELLLRMHRHDKEADDLLSVFELIEGRLIS